MEHVEMLLNVLVLDGEIEKVRCVFVSRLAVIIVLPDPRFRHCVLEYTFRK